MIALRRILVAGVATLLLAGACTSINLPSIPPINVPGATIPAINVPGFTLPAINIPGFSLPPGAAACTLVTSAEASQILGAQVTDQSDDPTNCTFLLPNFTAVSVTANSDTDLGGSQAIMGTTAQQSTIAGFPALSGAIFGQPVVYVQKPSGQIQVLGVLLGSDAATITKLQQLAAIAVGRTP